MLGSEENGRYLLEPGHYEVSYQLSDWKEKRQYVWNKTAVFSKIRSEVNAAILQWDKMRKLFQLL